MKRENIGTKGVELDRFCELFIDCLLDVNGGFDCGAAERRHLLALVERFCAMEVLCSEDGSSTSEPSTHVVLKLWLNTESLVCSQDFVQVLWTRISDLIACRDDVSCRAMDEDDPLDSDEQSGDALVVNAQRADVVDAQPLSTVAEARDLIALRFQQTTTIPLFDELPLAAQEWLSRVIDDVAGYAAHHWDGLARFEYLSDRVVCFLSRMMSESYPEHPGMFDPVELLNVESATDFRIPVRGLSVLHCQPHQHYVLAEGGRIWDGLAREGGAVPDSVPSQMVILMCRKVGANIDTTRFENQ